MGGNLPMCNDIQLNYSKDFIGVTLNYFQTHVYNIHDNNVLLFFTDFTFFNIDS